VPHIPGDGRKNKIQKFRVRRSSPETRCVDSWARGGDGGVWVRAHRTPRRALFTPYKVAAGPNDDIKLSKVRVTRGKYLDNGESFEIIDDFSNVADSHRILRAGWLGETEFRDSSEVIMDEPHEQGKLVARAVVSDDKPEMNIFPKAAHTLNSLTYVGIHSRVNCPVESCSGAGGRGAASLGRHCHESPYTHAVNHALSSDMQVNSTVCVGECQMNTDRCDRSYKTRSQACTKAEVTAGRRQSDGLGDSAWGGLTEMLRITDSRGSRRNCKKLWSAFCSACAPAHAPLALISLVHGSAAIGLITFRC